MDIAEDNRASFLTRTLRWLADFEAAMDMQPIDRIELRLGELERRFATLAPSEGAPSAAPARKAGEG